MAASLLLCESYIYAFPTSKTCPNQLCTKKQRLFNLNFSYSLWFWFTSSCSEEERSMRRSSFLDMGFFSRPSKSSSNILSFHSTAKWNAHLNASKATDKLMVIDFNASWCGPCKFMDSVIQDYATKYTDVEFIKIDADELMEVSQAFQVQTLPTFLLIKKGKVAERVTGARKEELEKLILNHRREIV